ncbi:MAG: TusE/DsrC/DsvC family sulfur relay protein [Thiotrichales bacterium]
MLSDTRYAAKAELLGVHIAPAWAEGGVKAFEARVRANAAAERLELTDQHWAAIRFVTNAYADHDETPNVRELASMLEQHFAAEGGKRLLYRLFPDGPIRQICRVAALDPPAHVANPGFGYTF